MLYTGDVSIDWATAAIIAAASIGLVNTIDSHLIRKRMPGLRVFFIPVGLVMVVFAVTIGTLHPLPTGFGGWPLAAALGANLLRVGGITIALYTMRTEEVSRVVPVVHTYPVFVALMAVPLLGEHLFWIDWLAICLVVSGAVLTSLRGGSGKIRLGSSFFQLILASLMLAGADVTAKYALNYVNFWQLYWLAATIMAVLFLGVGLRRHTWAQLLAMPARWTTLALVAVNESIGIFGAIMLFIAIANGPVSLVSTINTSRPFFVLMFAVVASLVIPSYGRWHGGRKTFMLRLAATALIVGGVTLIYLG